MGLPVASRLRGGRWLLPLATATALLYAWYIARSSFEVDGHRGFSLFDDAMISMRYARNLAQGAGLRWNVAEPPVEGYSDLLWTLWMAALQLLPLPQRSVSLWVSVSSAALLVANLWLVRRLVLGVSGREGSAFVAVVFCAVCYPLVFWSLRGLEVGALAFLVDSAILLAWAAEEGSDARGPWPLALVVSALVLVRDDAIVPVTMILVFLATDLRTRRVAAVSTVFVLATLLGHVAFRLAYYGAPLPNTYYLKFAGISLQERIARGLVAVLRTGAAELTLPLALAGLSALAQSTRRRIWLLASIVLGQVGGAVFVGGDAWESWGQPDRFLCVAIPALAALAVLGAEALWVIRRHRNYALVFFSAALAWRASCIAARDFIPRSFTFTPPIDLHGGLRGLVDVSGRALAGATLVAALTLAVRRRGPIPSWLAAAVATVAIVATVGTNWRDFMRGELTARQIDWDGRNAIFGIRLGEVVPPTTRIAVVAAGAIPFFSNLPSVDLLGKSDSHLAHERPVERFIPGHDKRDYAYSLATYEPDVVLELWHHAPEELDAIAALGYRRLPNGMYAGPACPTDLIDRILHQLPEYPFTANRPR